MAEIKPNEADEKLAADLIRLLVNAMRADSGMPTDKVYPRVVEMLAEHRCCGEPRRLRRVR